MQDTHTRPTGRFNALTALGAMPAAALSFAAWLQVSAVSWLLSARYQLELHEIGLVWAAGPLAAIAAQLLAGRWSDRHWRAGGRRRPFILAGGALAALTLLLLPRLDTLGALLGVGNLLVLAAIAAFTFELALNAALGPARALVADLTQDGAPRTGGFAWMQALAGCLGALAYLAGSWFEIGAVMTAGALAVFAFAVLPLLFVREPQNLSAAPVDEAASHAQPGQLWRICLAHGVAWLGVQAMLVYTIAFAQRYTVPLYDTPESIATQSAHVIALAFGLMNVAGCVATPLLLAPLATRFGRVRTHAACMALMAAACFAIAFKARSPHMLYALMAVAGIGWGAMLSLPLAIFSEQAARSRMAYLMGVFNLSIVVPQLMAVGVGFALGGTSEKKLLFVVCGSCLAVSALLWLRVGERRGARGAGVVTEATATGLN
ncbi:MAG: MFS transporter [Massilia sp.]